MRIDGAKISEDGNTITLSDNISKQSITFTGENLRRLTHYIEYAAQLRNIEDCHEEALEMEGERNGSF